MAGLSDFVAFIKTQGMAKSNRFSVSFNPIGNVSTSYSSLKNILLLCSQVTLPGSNIATTAARLYGETFEFGYEKNYPPVLMNFYVDSKFEVKGIFDAWTEEIYNTKTRQWGYYKDYTNDVEISVYDMESNEIYKVTLFEAYPKTISDIQFDYSGTGIANLQVTFAYKYFEVSSELTKAQEDSVKDNSLLGPYLKDFNDWQNNMVSNFSKNYNEKKDDLVNSAKNSISSILKKKK